MAVVNARTSSKLFRNGREKNHLTHASLPNNFLNYKVSATIFVVSLFLNFSLPSALPLSRSPTGNHRVAAEHKSLYNPFRTTARPLWSNVPKVRMSPPPSINYFVLVKLLRGPPNLTLFLPPPACRSSS